MYYSEHNDQLAHYLDKISSLSEEEKCNLGIRNVKPCNVSTVYFKTVFLYDKGKLVVADRVVKGVDFLKIIEPYKDLDYLLQMYYEYLCHLIEWYGIYGDYVKIDEKGAWEWNISKHQLAQYNLMRYIFPEDTWDKTKREYMVYHGSNKGGRPWTEMVIYQVFFTQKEYQYSIFWRVDTNNKGPYISMHFYNDYNKDNEQEKYEHVTQYHRYSNQIQEIFSSTGKENLWSWDEVYPGKKENHKELSLLLLHIDSILRNWDTEKEKFVRRIRFITEEFLKRQVNE